MNRRVAIVTGGASGIGEALARALAARGTEVVLADRQHALAATVADAIVADGGTASAAPLDVTDRGAFHDLAERVVSRTGRIDYLFNNAGIGVGGAAADFEPEDWDDVIDVNLRGVVHGIEAVYPSMRSRGDGHIVNTASVAGLVPTVFQASYTATKHAVVALSRALRAEASRYGVRVSVLCPGLIRTPILEGGKFGRLRFGVDPAKMATHLERGRPMDPSRLAPRVLDAVDRNRAIIVEPKAYKLLWYADRLSPRLYGAFLDHFARRTEREIEAMGED